MKKLDQTAILRSFSGAKRLEIAFQLSDMTREMALANIKTQNPGLSKKEQINLLAKRLGYGSERYHRTSS